MDAREPAPCCGFWLTWTLWMRSPVGLVSWVAPFSSRRYRPLWFERGVGVSLDRDAVIHLLQTRFGFRKEWRMAGVFKVEPLRDGDDLSGDEEDLYEENMRKVVKELGAMRVSERKTE